MYLTEGGTISWYGRFGGREAAGLLAVTASGRAAMAASSATSSTWVVTRTPWARAAVAVGVAGLFIETHPDPDHAPADGPNMVALRDFEPLMAELLDFDALAKRSR